MRLRDEIKNAVKTLALAEIYHNPIRVVVEEGKEEETAKSIAALLGACNHDCGDSFAYHAKCFGVVWHICWENSGEVLIFPCISINEMHELEELWSHSAT